MNLSEVEGVVVNGVMRQWMPPDWVLETYWVPAVENILDRGHIGDVREGIRRIEAVRASQEARERVRDRVNRLRTWLASAEEFERVNGEGSMLDPTHPYNRVVRPMRLLEPDDPEAPRREVRLFRNGRRYSTHIIRVRPGDPTDPVEVHHP
ncbi:MAG TPA: hypothetical protein VIO38_05305 [Rariglobus sp.]